MSEFDGIADHYATMVTDSLGGLRSVLDIATKKKVTFLTDRFFLDGALESSHKVVDLGCGIGLMHPHLPTSMIGIDGSWNELAIAKQSNPRSEYLCGDAMSMPLADGSVDGLIAINLLHHVTPMRRDRVFQEIHRVVRRGGRVAILEHTPWNPITRIAVWRCPFDRGVKLLSPGEVRSRLHSQGFTSSRTEFLGFSPWNGRLMKGLEIRCRKIPIGVQHCTLAYR